MQVIWLPPPTKFPIPPNRDKKVEREVKMLINMPPPIREQTSREFRGRGRAKEEL